MASHWKQLPLKVGFQVKRLFMQLNVSTGDKIMMVMRIIIITVNLQALPPRLHLFWKRLSPSWREVGALPLSPQLRCFQTPAAAPCLHCPSQDLLTHYLQLPILTPQWPSVGEQMQVVTPFPLVWFSTLPTEDGRTTQWVRCHSRDPNMQW